MVGYRRFQRWLAESKPDVAFLQELKAPQEKFPEVAIRETGYGAVWHGQESWNGVAILARGLEPVEPRRGLPDVEEFSAFTGLRQPTEKRSITRAHVIAWRKHLESRALAPASIRGKLSALSALFDYLCERNAISGNPVDGVNRPMANNNEGCTRRSVPVQ